MTQPRFLIAKYAANLQRMEPRNVGVVLWSAGKCACRFLSEDDVDFVSDKSLYMRWVTHWESLVASDAIETLPGETVSKLSESFLDALRRTQRGNFLLFDAGMLLEESVEDIGDAVDFLFDELVAPLRNFAEDAGGGELFAQRCDRLLEESGLSARESFSSPYTLKVPIHRVPQNLSFHYALATNGKPESVFHRVRIAQQAVTSAAFKFEWTKKRLRLGKDKCFALCEVALESPEAQPLVRLLDQFATVVDVTQSDAAIEVLKKAA